MSPNLHDLLTAVQLLSKLQHSLFLTKYVNVEVRYYRCINGTEEYEKCKMMQKFEIQLVFGWEMIVTYCTVSPNVMREFSDEE